MWAYPHNVQTRGRRTTASETMRKNPVTFDDLDRLIIDDWTRQGSEPMRRKEKTGQAQLEILRYIQDHHPVTVRQVADHVAEARGLTRTTALNVMERLREKGYLTRELVEGV